MRTYRDSGIFIWDCVGAIVRNTHSTVSGIAVEGSGFSGFGSPSNPCHKGACQNQAGELEFQMGSGFISIPGSRVPRSKTPMTVLGHTQYIAVDLRTMQTITFVYANT